MAAATLCDGDKDGVDLQLERRLSPQLPQRAREEGGGGEASSGPFLVVVVLRGRRPPDLFLSPPPSCARWRKPRRRPPPLPPRPVDARAFRPPVDARTHPRLPIDDGGDGGAALPVAKKSPSSSSSRALDRDAAEAEVCRRLTSSRREALGLYRDILRGRGSLSAAATPCNRRSTDSPRHPTAWSRPRRPSADASHRGGRAAAGWWRTWGAAITTASRREAQRAGVGAQRA
uniref:Uncharacterized protein n=1 Tax=Oryza sativa subsp. japonica TaxID=39947 RepID=Q6Z7E1_ORYSJ|nr:hypothetical protein [Oryza sativa Japonica Group]